MSFPDFAITYFTSKPTVTALLLFYSVIGILLAVFRLKKEQPEQRSRILVSLLIVTVTSWSFLAFSLLFCRAFLGLYEGENLMAVEVVFGLALLASLVTALPLSLIVTSIVPTVMSTKLARELPEPDVSTLAVANRMMMQLGLSRVKFLQSPGNLPLAYSIGGSRSVIVISKGLVDKLESDELETVLSHELAHIKNKDSQLSTIISVYRRILFFDPLVRLLETGFHAENEFLADELSAKETRKPLSLASALIKIHSAFSGKSRVKIVGLSILGKIEFISLPTVGDRIQRVLRIADELEKRGKPLRGRFETPIYVVEP